MRGGLPLLRVRPTVLGLAVAVGLLVPAARAEELPSFEVTAQDGRLAPAELSVPAGQRIKLVVRNLGKSPIEFENLDMRVEKVLAPGANSFVVLPRLKPGRYEFIDEFHPATAKLTVVAK